MQRLPHLLNNDFQKTGDFFDDSWLKFLHNLNESLSNKSINVLYDYWLNEVDTKSQYDFIKRNHKMILNEFLKISNPELFECTLPEFHNYHFYRDFEYPTNGLMFFTYDTYNKSKIHT